jgi:hypothetical protein
MQHWYFFSYARANRHPYLKRFYNDLWTVMSQNLTKLEQTHRSFTDWESLELMSRWSRDLQEALEWSNVLICIVSPAYVTQEWCGRELGFFEQVAAHHYGAADQILPVLWSRPEIDAAGNAALPAALKAYQFSHQDLPDVYEKDGLFSLMYEGKAAYKKCVTTFARRILDKGRANPARGGKPGLRLADTPSAFDVKDSVRTRVVIRSDAGSAWQPFLPPAQQDEKAAELVETVIARRQAAFVPLDVGPRFVDEVAQCSAQGDPVVIVLDPKMAEDPQKLDDLVALDRKQHKTTALFVPWNEQDPVIQLKRDALETAINDTVTPHIAFPNPPLRTARQLQQELNATLERFEQLATNRDSAGRPVTDQFPRVDSAPAGVQ